ncbi:MAG TPA: hypothetical protein VF905_03215 [Nitrospirota bacterium]
MVTQMAKWTDRQEHRTGARIWLRSRLAVASLFSILLLGILSCTTGPHAGGSSGAVRYIQIRHDFTPSTLYARVGDEIRWHNVSPDPVRVGILDNKWRDHVACEKGFTRFGTMEDVVTIQPQEYVSLCFSKAATVRYNVWLHAENLKGSMSPTAAIRID